MLPASKFSANTPRLEGNAVFPRSLQAASSVGDGSRLTGIVGTSGPAGPQGATGPQGTAGATGPQGATGLQGPAGPQGPLGDEGPQGPQGPQGAKGLSWKAAWSALDNYLSDDAVSYNGSAWLAKRANSNVTPVEGNDWTLLAQKGDAGATGPQGAQGSIGTTHPQGPHTATGLQAATASIGPQGVTGLLGPAGPQGPQGDTGPQGAQGIPGLEGPQGPQGAKGLNWQVVFNDAATSEIYALSLHDALPILAKRANSNVTPVEGNDWTLLAQKGDTGATGPQGAQG